MSGVYYARASSNYSDFLKRHLYLRNRLLDQGYKKIRLIRSLKKFIFRYQDLVEIYSVSLCRDNGEWWIFTKWKCIKIRKSITMSRIFLSMCDVKVFLTFIFVVKILQGTRGCWWRYFTIDVPPSLLDLVLRWLLFYLFCSSIVINAVIVTVGTLEM